MHIFASVAPLEKTTWHVHGFLQQTMSTIAKNLPRTNLKQNVGFILTVLARKEAAGRRPSARAWMVVKGRAENDVDLRPLILSDLKRLCASQIHASPGYGGRCPTLLPLRLRKTSIRKRSRMSPHTATDDLNPSLKRLRVGVYGEQADAVIPHVVSVVVANTNGETKILSADYQVGFGAGGCCLIF
jgi:hypothetical protein